jgi:hypothetical protein
MALGSLPLSSQRPSNPKFALPHQNQVSRMLHRLHLLSRLTYRSRTTSLDALQRKYEKLNDLYQESKRQITILKTELTTKNEEWRVWKDWWDRQKSSLRLKSADGSLRAMAAQAAKKEGGGDQGTGRLGEEGDVMDVDEVPKGGSENEGDVDAKYWLPRTIV